MGKKNMSAFSASLFSCIFDNMRILVLVCGHSFYKTLPEHQRNLVGF